MSKQQEGFNPFLLARENEKISKENEAEIKSFRRFGSPFTEEEIAQLKEMLLKGQKESYSGEQLQEDREIKRPFLVSEKIYYELVDFCVDRNMLESEALHIALHEFLAKHSKNP